jgi:hypothetical protein
MIILKNIVKQGNLMSATVYIIDGSDRIFEITTDAEIEEILVNTLGKMNSYVAHARWKIMVLYGNGKKCRKK